MTKISIIIPSYNSYQTIEQTLQGFNNQTYKDLIEIIVVDSSDDNITRPLLLKYQSKNVRIIDSGKKVIPAVGRNIGAKEARGELLIFIDSDAFPERDFIDIILSEYHKGCLVGSGSINLPSFQKNKVIPIAQFFLQFNEYMDVGSKIEKQFVPSCSLFCDKKLFDQIGGFPIIRASEDTVFGLKASKITKVWFVPEAKVYHIFREDFKSFLANQKVLGKYIIIYRRIEYGNKFYYRGVFPLFFLPFFLLIKLIRITSRIFKGGFSVIGRYLWSFPIFALGLCYWAIGFTQGIFQHDDHY